MGMFSTPDYSTAETVDTKVASTADDAVQEAYQASKKRYASAGTKTTILTSGTGASSTPSTSSKTLLGQ